VAVCRGDKASRHVVAEERNPLSPLRGASASYPLPHRLIRIWCDEGAPRTSSRVIGSPCRCLGANSSVFVANKAKYVDLIIALQPSMLSWNPPVTGNVGRMIEIYNPNPWMTFGGMGSKKLFGPNIE
jgi:hypothetical protein